MQQKVRYPLLLGLVIALFEFVFFAIGHFSYLMATFDFVYLFLFIISFLTLIFIFKSFKCYNLPTSIFKKQRKNIWISIVLIAIYWFYLAIILATDLYDSFYITLGHLVILTGVILLLIIGIFVRINDQGLIYDEKN